MHGGTATIYVFIHNMGGSVEHVQGFWKAADAYECGLNYLTQRAHLNIPLTGDWEADWKRYQEDLEESEGMVDEFGTIHELQIW